MTGPFRHFKTSPEIIRLAVQADAKPAEIAAVHASVPDHFNQERHRSSRDDFEQTRAAALADWRQLCAA